MAVTTQYSTEFNQDFQAPQISLMLLKSFQLVAMPFAFTQSGAGDATSVAKLRRLPSGPVWLFPTLSRIRWTAFGASRTLDIGHEAYTGYDGTTTAASTALLDSAVDVSSAGVAAMGSSIGTGGTGGGYLALTSNGGINIVATVAGGTIPDAATLKGYLVIGHV